MEKKIISKNQVSIAVFKSDEVLITDEQSALDFLMSTLYNDNCSHIVINKEILCNDFFVLSTGIAGDILQKVVNYQMKIAIVGDYSNYESKPLNDFIYECNNGNSIFFVKDEEKAISKLVD